MANKGHGDANKTVAKNEINTVATPTQATERGSFGNGFTSGISRLTLLVELPPNHDMTRASTVGTP